MNFRRIFLNIFKQYRGVLLVFWPTFKFLYRCLVRIENMMAKWWKLSFFWQSYLLSCKNLPFLSVDRLFLLPKFWFNFHLFLLLSAIRNDLVYLNVARVLKILKDLGKDHWGSWLKASIRAMKILTDPLESLKNFHQYRFTLYHTLLNFRQRKKSLNSLKI